MAGERKKFRFLARLVQNGTMDAGYIVFPYDIRKEFGKGLETRPALGSYPLD